MQKLPFITIVSGLPRSGTSMMMQLIETGGIPALTDHVRTRDEDNPRGHYEFEPVKRTKHDPSWVPTALGKVVKMVYLLLYDLPDGYEYRVVFMRRDLDEVLSSQKVMLQRSGKQGASISDEELKELFRTQLRKFDQWIATRTNSLELVSECPCTDGCPSCVGPGGENGYGGNGEALEILKELTVNQ